MNQAQASRRIWQNVLDATAPIQELVKAGRLPPEALQARRDLADEAMAYVRDHWISFDGMVPEDEPPAPPPTDPDSTRPSMESAIIAAEERKRK